MIGGNKAHNRIRKMISAAASWRASGKPEDMHQAAAALARARALCEKYGMDQRNFIWPDKRPDRLIIDDPAGPSGNPAWAAEAFFRETQKAEAKKRGYARQPIIIDDIIMQDLAIKTLRDIEMEWGVDLARAEAELHQAMRPPRKNFDPTKAPDREGNIR